MKKIFSILLAAVLAAGVLSACGQTSPGQDISADNQSAAENEAPEAAGGEELSIVTTIFPEYDWVCAVLGDNPANAEVTMLLDNGVDLHSYQPTANDILTIANCDVFIYVGGESDEWVEDALKEATNDEMVVIDLLDVLGENVKEEETVEGMEAEEEEESEEGEEGPEYDEHVWLSLKNAEIFVNAIADTLEKADAGHAEVYSENAAAYIEKLHTLDAAYQDAAANAATKTLLFGDRFPFRYLTDDYGLSYYAAFAGCSAETEASFETVVYLANKADEENISTILTIEGSDQKIAETINENTKNKDHQILVMDSMQGTTSKDIADGASYLSVMEKNLETLKQALQ